MTAVSTDQEQTDLLPGAEGASTEPAAEGLTDELARKYDPERLLKMVSRRAGKGTTLDHDIRAKYEKRFGVDLGHVRIYTGEFAEEFNRQRSAYAVTIGSTGMILMGGSPNKSMGTNAGQALLAHELTHVAQAKRGLHRAAHEGAMPLATESHEAEAEAVEADVARGGDGAASAEPGGAASKLAKDAKDALHEQIKQRVLDMAADAARAFYWRNGVDRRP